MESTIYMKKISSIEEMINDRQSHLEDYLYLSYLLFTNNDLAGYREACRTILDEKKKRIKADIYNYYKMISDFKTELRVRTNTKSISAIDIDDYSDSSDIARLYNLVLAYEIKIKSLKKEIKKIDTEIEALSFRSESETKSIFISRYKGESDYFKKVTTGIVSPNEKAILKLMKKEEDYKLLVDTIKSIRSLKKEKESLEVSIPVNLDTLISNTEYFKKKFNLNSNVLTLDFAKLLLLGNNIRQELNMLNYLKRKLAYFSEERLNRIIGINHTSMDKVDNLIVSYSINVGDKDYKAYQELLSTYDNLKSRISKLKKSKSRSACIALEINNHKLLKVSRSIIDLVINNAKCNRAHLLNDINQRYGTTKINTLVNDLELFLDNVNNGIDVMIEKIHEIDNNINSKVSLLESKAGQKLDVDRLISTDDLFKVYETTYSKTHAQIIHEDALTRLTTHKKKEKPKVYELL